MGKPADEVQRGERKRATRASLRSFQRVADVVGANERGEPIVEVDGTRLVLPQGASRFRLLDKCSRCGRDSVGDVVADTAHLRRSTPTFCERCTRESIDPDGAGLELGDLGMGWDESESQPSIEVDAAWPESEALERSPGAPPAPLDADAVVARLTQAIHDLAASLNDQLARRESALERQLERRLEEHSWTLPSEVGASLPVPLDDLRADAERHGEELKAAVTDQLERRYQELVTQLAVALGERLEEHRRSLERELELGREQQAVALKGTVSAHLEHQATTLAGSLADRLDQQIATLPARLSEQAATLAHSLYERLDQQVATLANRLSEQPATLAGPLADRLDQQVATLADRVDQQAATLARSFDERLDQQAATLAGSLADRLDQQAATLADRLVEQAATPSRSLDERLDQHASALAGTFTERLAQQAATLDALLGDRLDQGHGAVLSAFRESIAEQFDGQSRELVAHGEEGLVIALDLQRQQLMSEVLSVLADRDAKFLSGQDELGERVDRAAERGAATGTVSLVLLQAIGGRVLASAEALSAEVTELKSELFFAQRALSHLQNQVGRLRAEVVDRPKAAPPTPSLFSGLGIGSPAQPVLGDDPEPKPPVTPAAPENPAGVGPEDG